MHYPTKPSRALCSSRFKERRPVEFLTMEADRTSYYTALLNFSSNWSMTAFYSLLFQTAAMNYSPLLWSPDHRLWRRVSIYINPQKEVSLTSADWKALLAFRKTTWKIFFNITLTYFHQSAKRSKYAVFLFSFSFLCRVQSLTMNRKFCAL